MKIEKILQYKMDYDGNYLEWEKNSFVVFSHNGIRTYIVLLNYNDIDNIKFENKFLKVDDENLFNIKEDILKKCAERVNECIFKGFVIVLVNYFCITDDTFYSHFSILDKVNIIDYSDWIVKNMIE